MKYVQSFITNISFPTTVDELGGFYPLLHMERILGIKPDYVYFEEILQELGVNTDEVFIEDYFEGVCENIWTVPVWAKPDDIIFFYHSKSANRYFSNLINELHSKKNSFDEDEYWAMLNAINRAKATWREYGGKIFAVGRVSGCLERQEDQYEKDFHWKSNVYAPIDSIFVLENPIGIEEFNSHITISRQATITPVLGEDFEYLKRLIIKKNKDVRSFLIESDAQLVPYSKLNKENWLQVTNQHNRSFISEYAFGKYYVNNLLPLLGDRKQFYEECCYKKKNQKQPRVDRIIHFKGKYLPVELKLNIKAEKDITAQLDQYMDAVEVKLSKDKCITGEELLPYVIVIDTEKVYLYDGRRVSEIFILDDLEDVENIGGLKDIIYKLVV